MFKGKIPTKMDKETYFDTTLTLFNLSTRIAALIVGKVPIRFKNWPQFTWRKVMKCLTFLDHPQQTLIMFFPPLIKLR
jgi:hypothetical protein